MEEEEVEMLGTELWVTRGRLRAGRGGGMSDAERE